jgi:5-formyltetrahydrofolate cyclo-ligase
MNPGDSKNALRQQIRARLNGMTPERRAADSAKACALLEQQAVWKQARTILFYAPLPDEPDLWPLVSVSLAAGRTIALPWFDAKTDHYIAARIQDPANDVRFGRFGIREPTRDCPVIPLNQLEFLLVPGVAYDLRGRRLGRGKGFYDQMLALVRGTTCGVAFEEQIVDEVPVEPHDVHLNCILTPSRWIEPGSDL